LHCPQPLPFCRLTRTICPRPTRPPRIQRHRFSRHRQSRPLMPRLGGLTHIRRHCRNKAAGSAVTPIRRVVQLSGSVGHP
jgi:hypothetical protein